MNVKLTLALLLVFIPSVYGQYQMEEARPSSQQVGTPSEQQQIVAPSMEEEYGNKYLNLVRLHDLLQGIKGVEVPMPKGIASSRSHQFLDQTAPGVGQIWQHLGQLFEAYRQTVSQDAWPAFLEKPEVVRLLTQLHTEIETAYQAAASNPDQYELMGITPEMVQWLQTIHEKGRYLMVRSSGAEDTKKLANAGGNLSVAYVPSTPEDVALNVGRVVASYYSPSSLKNRLVSGDDPFLGKQRLAVVVMELVGEPVGGAKDESSVPVSLVLFTNEPLYTNNSFRIMRISSTYGHGEAVVQNMGIGSDTYLLMDSATKPGELYVLSQTAPKTERLVPLANEEGKVSLEKQRNPSDRIEGPTFDAAMLKRLYEMGIAVEKAYGYPMDMEVVVREGTIYPLQARPVNRPELRPTYLDRQQLAATPTVLNTYSVGQVVVVGGAQVEVLTSPDQVLRAGTLEHAQALYKKGKHRVVVINHEEPANSHPVVNFSSWGVPVLFFPESVNIDEVIKQASDKSPLVVDSQSGMLALWVTDVAPVADLIKTGYLIHPANIEPQLNVDKLLAAKKALYVGTAASDVDEVSQDLRDLCFASDRDAKIQDLGQLPILKSLQAGADRFRNIDFTSLAGNRVHMSYQLVNNLQSAIDTVVDEWIASLSLPDPDGLRCRFYAKVVDKTLSDWLPLAIEEMNNVQRMYDYQTNFAQLPLFAEQAAYATATWDPRSAKAWIAFLTSIEKAVSRLPAHVIPPEDIQRFQDTLRKYDELGILPKWMFLVFSPIYLKDAPADGKADQDPKRVREMFQRILAELKPEVEGQLQLLQEQNQRIAAVSAQLGLFEDPKTFDKAWKSLQEAVAPFQKETDGGVYLELLKTAPVVTRLVASDVLGNVVDLVDLAIKRVLTSSAFPDDKKVELLGQMLQTDFALLRDWAKILVKFPEQWMTTDRYLALVEKGLANTGSSSRELQSVPGFNVFKAIMENPAVKESFPTHKEGYFTLIHQNLLSVLQRYIASMLPKDIIFPKIFEGIPDMFTQLQSTLSSHFKHLNTTPSRVSIVGSQLTLAYNIPLREHSAILQVAYDKNSQHAEIEMRVFGFNEAGRWVVLAEYADLLAKGAGVPLIRPSEISRSNVAIYMLARNPEQAKALFLGFEKMIGLTFKIAFPYLPSKLWGDLEQALTPLMAHLSLEQQKAVLEQAYVKALLLGKINPGYEDEVYPLIKEKGLTDQFVKGMLELSKSSIPEDQRLALEYITYLDDSVNPAQLDALLETMLPSSDPLIRNQVFYALAWRWSQLKEPALTQMNETFSAIRKRPSVLSDSELGQFAQAWTFQIKATDAQGAELAEQVSKFIADISKMQQYYLAQDTKVDGWLAELVKRDAFPPNAYEILELRVGGPNLDNDVIINQVLAKLPMNEIPVEVFNSLLKRWWFPRVPGLWNSEGLVMRMLASDRYSEAAADLIVLNYGSIPEDIDVFAAIGRARPNGAARLFLKEMESLGNSDSQNQRMALLFATNLVKERPSWFSLEDPDVVNSLLSLAKTGIFTDNQEEGALLLLELAKGGWGKSEAQDFCHSILGNLYSKSYDACMSVLQVK